MISFVPKRDLGGSLERTLRGRSKQCPEFNMGGDEVCEVRDNFDISREK